MHKTENSLTESSGVAANAEAHAALMTLTSAAQEKIRQVLKEEGGSLLRVFVQGGGCSGFQYGFRLEDEAQEDDQRVDNGDFSLLVDPFSAPLVQGSTVDWKETLQGSQFVLDNPNAVASCGCGSSFTV